MKKAYKILELDGKKPANNEAEGVSNLKGRIVILNPEQSEIAGHLEIKEKGVFAIKSI